MEDLSHRKYRGKSGNSKKGKGISSFASSSTCLEVGTSCGKTTAWQSVVFYGVKMIKWFGRKSRFLKKLYITVVKKLRSYPKEDIIFEEESWQCSMSMLHGGFRQLHAHTDDVILNIGL